MRACGGTENYGSPLGTFTAPMAGEVCGEQVSVRSWRARVPDTTGDGCPLSVVVGRGSTTLDLTVITAAPVTVFPPTGIGVAPGWRAATNSRG